MEPRLFTDFLEKKSRKTKTTDDDHVHALFTPVVASEAVLLVIAAIAGIVHICTLLVNKNSDEITMVERFTKPLTALFCAGAVISEVSFSCSRPKWFVASALVIYALGDVANDFLWNTHFAAVGAILFATGHVLLILGSRYWRTDDGNDRETITNPVYIVVAGIVIGATWAAFAVGYMNVFTAIGLSGYLCIVVLLCKVSTECINIPNRSRGLFATGAHLMFASDIVLLTSMVMMIDGIVTEEMVMVLYYASILSTTVGVLSINTILTMMGSTNTMDLEFSPLN